ncbi:MAG TPA: ABC transporter substrate-binding protein [bacterium]|nr:ABC transporter substrate-binding protein [bacterium]
MMSIRILTACALALALAAAGPTMATGATALTIDLQGDPATLDPGRQYDTNSYDVYRNIYDNFLHRNPQTSAIEAYVATAWKAVTPTEWHFTIRKDIKFHDGTPLVAADVEATLERILDRQFNSPQYANFNAIASVKATGPDALTIITSRPYPVLLAQLVNLSIVSKAYVAAHDQPYVNAHPMGSGPYRFDAWLRGDHVTLRAVPGYWRGRPQIEEVTFRTVPETATRVADLQSGRVQLALGLTSDDVKTIKSDPKLQLLGGATERVAYLAFNALGPSPMRDVRAREAIAHAVDAPSLIRILLAGYARSVTALLTSRHFGYDAKIPGYPHDLAKVKQMLAESGHAGGLTLVFTTSPTYDQRIIQAIQGQLEQAGVTVKTQSYDFGTYLQKIQSPQHDWGDLRYGQWSCSCLDADGVIYPLFHTGSIWSSYSDPAFDKAVDDARSTLDAAARKAAYSIALNVLQRDVPDVPLWEVVALYGADRNLHWHPTVDEQLFVADMALGH